MREGGAVLVGAEAVVEDQRAEQDQGRDLPCDTGHHEIVAEFLGGVRVSGGGDATAGALEDEGEEIAEDEDPGVVFGSDERVITTNGEDEVFESEVDPCGEESRGDDEAADLDVEAIAVVGVAVQHYPPDVADCFAQAAEA